jgi:hypothetical protein
VIEIARADGVQVKVGDLPVDDLYRASELFLTSTARRDAGRDARRASGRRRRPGAGHDEDQGPVLGDAPRPRYTQEVGYPAARTVGS